MVDNFIFKDKYDVDDLVNVIRILRQPGGCPWDREQTHKSIRNNFIEETYEAVEAIDNDSPEMLREELGDVLMQVLLHSVIAEEDKEFNFFDVVDELTKKLIIRHPHVFGDARCDTAEEVLVTWNEVKMKTKNQNDFTQTLTSVPKQLPALMRAEKVQSRAAKAGFDWDEVSGALEKVYSESEELKSAICNNNQENAEEELGDLLFSCVNVSRFINCNPEQALTKATDKFIKRFAVVEDIAKRDGIDMKTASLELLDKYWDEAKEQTK